MVFARSESGAWGRSSMVFMGAAILLLSGCAASVKGLRKDPSFVHETVISGRMAIGGVSSLVKPLESETATSYANLLRTQLLDVREDYTVNTVGTVSGALGEAGYKKVVDEFTKSGALSAAALSEIAGKLKGARYVLFARIDSDDVERSRTEKQKTDKKGKAIPGAFTIRKEVLRSVSVTFDIYDLEMKQSVWAGVIDDSARRSAEFEKEDALVSLVKVVANSNEKDSAKYPDPVPPSSEDILKSLFTGFARNMPKD